MKINIVENKFTCKECEHTNTPETNTEDGILTANLEEILSELKEKPTKIIYGICPICGMEYTFAVSNDALILLPSEEMK